MRVSCAINVLLVSFLTHYTKYHSKGTQDATFVSSSSIEDHGPEHVDDNTPKTFWESAATNKFPVWIEVEFNHVVQIFSYHMSRTESKKKSPVFFRLEGYSALASGRMGGQEGQDENIGVLMDERVLQGSVINTLSEGGSSFCVYPNHRGERIKKARLIIFRVYGDSDSFSEKTFSVALTRFFITTHEEEEEALGGCTDRR